MAGNSELKTKKSGFFLVIQYLTQDFTLKFISTYLFDIQLYPFPKYRQQLMAFTRSFSYLAAKCWKALPENCRTTSELLLSVNSVPYVRVTE